MYYLYVYFDLVKIIGHTQPPHKKLRQIIIDYYRTVSLLSITTYLLLSTLKCLLFLFDFYRKCVFSTGFSKTDPM